MLGSYLYIFIALRRCSQERESCTDSLFSEKQSINRVNKYSWRETFSDCPHILILALFLSVARTNIAIIMNVDLEQGNATTNKQAEPSSPSRRPKLAATHQIVSTSTSQWRSNMRGVLDAMEEASKEFRLQREQQQDSLPKQAKPKQAKPSEHVAVQALEGSSNTGKTDDHEPTETKVLNVSEYCPSETLEESIDVMITNSSVLMFEKTWCLFCHDARDFLLHQLGVSIVTVPIDEAVNGSAIETYIRSKTGHSTYPAIFVKGDFLGGFEDVNAMYSTGELEAEYLKELTQADRCEMEVRAMRRGATQPLFWFPPKVNGHAVRMTGVLTCATALTSVATFFLTWWGQYIALALAFDFCMRILAGSRFSFLGQLAGLLVSSLEPKPRMGRPKQFAGKRMLRRGKSMQFFCSSLTFGLAFAVLPGFPPLACCGLMFSTLAAVGYFVPFPYHEYVGAAFCAMLAGASGMEGFLDFCLGCVFFKIGIQLGIFPK